MAVGVRLRTRYDSRLRGLRFSPFFQHGSTPKPYNNIMLPCDSGADESNSCNSSANFPPIQIMQLCLTSIWHCSANYLVNNKSRDQFRFLIREVSISVFRFWRNIDTTTGNTALLKNYHSHNHCLLSKWKHVTCADSATWIYAKRQKPRRKRFRKSHGYNNNNVRLIQLQSERYNRRNGNPLQVGALFTMVLI